MALIESITPEKWEELVNYRDNVCSPIGSCTAPADWEKAEKNITLLYRKMGWDNEITFHRVSSPKAAQTLMREKFGATEFVDTNLWGQIDIYWIGYLRFLSTIPGIEADEGHMSLLGIWEEIANSISLWYVVDEVTCIMVDHPEEIHWNDQRVLHNPEGMSVRFRDGWGTYTYNGVSIPKDKSHIITNPESITADMIKSEDNLEIRRVMTEIMGISKFLTETNAELVDMDMVKVWESGEDSMPRCLIKDDENRQFLVGTDGSTKRTYYMEVDPEAKTCIEAHNSIAPFDESVIIGNS